MFIRTDLALIGVGVLFGDYQMYNVLITAHGLVMIFGFIMPVVLGGFTNYFCPVYWVYPICCLLVLIILVIFVFEWCFCCVVFLLRRVWVLVELCTHL